MSTLTPSPPLPTSRIYGLPPASPLALTRSLFAHRDLLWQMTKREVVGRYRGSVLGLFWSFFHPLIMLAVYTFAFSYIFKVSFKLNSPAGSPAGPSDHVDFALYCFAGLILFTVFSEVLTRAPVLILQNVNYVKRVVFPLEILPVVTLGSALIHALISSLVLLLGFLLAHGQFHWTALLLPLVVLPLALLILGLAWFLASLGVYIRDIAQAIGIITTMFMYLSPIFYDASNIQSPTIQRLIALNPLTIPIQDARILLFKGALPDFLPLGLFTLISLLLCWLGFAWFQRTKRGFPDVL